MDLEFRTTVLILGKTISSMVLLKKLTICILENKKIGQANLLMCQEPYKLEPKEPQRTNLDYNTIQRIFLMSTRGNVEMLGKFKTYVLSITTQQQHEELGTTCLIWTRASKIAQDKLDYHNNKRTSTTQTSNIKRFKTLQVVSIKSTAWRIRQWEVLWTNWLTQEWLCPKNKCKCNITATSPPLLIV